MVRHTCVNATNTSHSLLKGLMIRNDWLNHFLKFAISTVGTVGTTVTDCNWNIEKT